MTPLTFVYKKQNPASPMCLFIIFCDSLNAPQILTENYANTAKNRNSFLGNEYIDPLCQKVLEASVTRARKCFIRKAETRATRDRSAINARILWETIA